MRRKILITVLALGTVGGYASGFVHMRHQHERWAAFHHGEGGCHARDDARHESRDPHDSREPAQAE